MFKDGDLTYHEYFSKLCVDHRLPAVKTRHPAYLFLVVQDMLENRAKDLASGPK